MMNNSFFTIFGALMAQPQMDPPQTMQPRTSGPGQGLASYALPGGPVGEGDMPRIQSAIEQVLANISASLKSTGQGATYADLATVRSGIVTFMEWLNQQGCVQKASTTYDVETTDKYDRNIFAVYPGQLPFDIVFNMNGAANSQYRLLVFVSRVDLLSFGNLMANTSLSGVPVPENWPSSYLEKRP